MKVGDGNSKLHPKWREATQRKHASPKLMAAMLDSISDRVAENRAKERIATLPDARKITLDDL